MSTAWKPDLGGKIVLLQVESMQASHLAHKGQLGHGRNAADACMDTQECTVTQTPLQSCKQAQHHCHLDKSLVHQRAHEYDSTYHDRIVAVLDAVSCMTVVTAADGGQIHSCADHCANQLQTVRAYCCSRLPALYHPGTKF